MTPAASRGPRLVTFGETLALVAADRAGPLARGAAMTLRIGGAESNVAIGAARLGLEATWVGRVGADPLGRMVAREIAAEGVQAVAIVDCDAPTGLMVKEQRTTTRQSIAYYRKGSAGSRLRHDDVPEELIADAGALHLTGITAALSSSARGALLQAVAIAGAARVPVSFDLNYRAALWSEAEAGSFYRSLLPAVDWVFAGEDEARLACGPLDDAEALARGLVELGAGAAIIKRGARGALSLVDGVVLEHPAIPVQAADTVGAGDAFVAGYLAERLMGGDPAACLSTAVTAATFVCATPGDWDGLPYREELAHLVADEPVMR